MGMWIDGWMNNINMKTKRDGYLEKVIFRIQNMIYTGKNVTDQYINTIDEQNHHNSKLYIYTLCVKDINVNNTA